MQAKRGRGGEGKRGWIRYTKSGKCGNLIHREGGLVVINNTKREMFCLLVLNLFLLCDRRCGDDFFIVLATLLRMTDSDIRAT
jgi:hypothetical protein